MRKDSIQEREKKTGLAGDNWPQRLLEWYWEVKRDLPWRRTSDPYHIWISEVMLQQTQVKTVIPYYHNFLKRFPDLSALAQASLEEVLELWRGLGYYSRAKNLWQGARYVLESVQGRMPGAYQELLKIPGVGEYTAGAVASIAYGECVPAVDGNVKRVVSRFLAWEEEIESVKSRRQILQHLESWQPQKYAGDFNQALMELGATVCTPKSPKCPDCPINEGCSAFIQGNPLVFPVKRGKVKITEAIRPTLILLRQGKVLLKRRPSEGLLANLWEFPGEEYLIEKTEKQKTGKRRLEPELLELRQSAVQEIGLVAESQAGYGNSKDLINTESLAELIDRPIGDDDEGFPWFALYRNQVVDRTYDQAVEMLLKENPLIGGPYIHTFSHRRWSIYWVVLDLDRALPGKNSSEGEAEAEAETETETVSVSVSVSVNVSVNVTGTGTGTGTGEGEEYRWINLGDLEKIALPVAFQRVWASCLAGQ
jgi:A/G-specific adenine glycosylase